MTRLNVTRLEAADYQGLPRVTQEDRWLLPAMAMCDIRTLQFLVNWLGILIGLLGSGLVGVLRNPRE